MESLKVGDSLVRETDQSIAIIDAIGDDYTLKEGTSYNKYPLEYLKKYYKKFEFSKKGLKYDQYKTRFDLLPVEPIEEVANILTYGANKYKPNSWRGVEDGIERYYSALMRHLVAWRKGEDLDKESDKRHLAHAMCNILFLMELDK